MADDIPVALIALGAAALGYVAQPLSGFLLDKTRHDRDLEEEARSRRRRRLEDLLDAMLEVIAASHRMQAAVMGQQVDVARGEGAVAEARVRSLAVAADDAPTREAGLAFADVAADRFQQRDRAADIAALAATHRAAVEATGAALRQMG